MSFKYDLTANQQTPTSYSKVVLCKSFKIDIANGSGFTTATEYDLGWLPKDAQVVHAYLCGAVAVSGGTVSASTLTVKVNNQTLFLNTNVFSVVNSTISSTAYHTSGLNPTTDQKVTYIPTLTGAGATAGIIYINIFYVV